MMIHSVAIAEFESKLPFTFYILDKKNLINWRQMRHT